MSLLDRSARRLAAREAERYRGRELSRREVVASGAAALGALALLGSFPRGAMALTADDYCYKPCVKAAKDRLAAEGTRLKALIIRSILNPGSGSRLEALNDCAFLRANHYAAYFEAVSDCQTPNCGDPKKYPPPPPPQPTCAAPCPSGASCQPCPTTAGGGICCLDIFPLVNGKSQCCPG